MTCPGARNLGPAVEATVCAVVVELTGRGRFVSASHTVMGVGQFSAHEL
jgi:hypothetical protein